MDERTRREQEDGETRGTTGEKPGDPEAKGETRGRTDEETGNPQGDPASNRPSDDARGEQRPVRVVVRPRRPTPRVIVSPPQVKVRARSIFLCRECGRKSPFYLPFCVQCAGRIVEKPREYHAVTITGMRDPSVRESLARFLSEISTDLTYNRCSRTLKKLPLLVCNDLSRREARIFASRLQMLGARTEVKRSQRVGFRDRLFLEEGSFGNKSPALEVYWSEIPLFTLGRYTYPSVFQLSSIPHIRGTIKAIDQPEFKTILANLLHHAHEILALAYSMSDLALVSTDSILIGGVEETLLDAFHIVREASRTAHYLELSDQQRLRAQVEELRCRLAAAANPQTRRSYRLALVEKEKEIEAFATMHGRVEKAVADLTHVCAVFERSHVELLRMLSEEEGTREEELPPFSLIRARLSSLEDELRIMEKTIEEMNTLFEVEEETT